MPSLNLDPQDLAKPCGRRGVLVGRRFHDRRAAAVDRGVAPPDDVAGVAVVVSVLVALALTGTRRSPWWRPPLRPTMRVAGGALAMVTYAIGSPGRHRGRMTPVAARPGSAEHLLCAGVRYPELRGEQ